jgi:hypothetical protein
MELIHSTFLHLELVQTSFRRTIIERSNISVTKSQIALVFRIALGHRDLLFLAHRRLLLRRGSARTNKNVSSAAVTYHKSLYKANKIFIKVKNYVKKRSVHAGFILSKNIIRHNIITNQIILHKICCPNDILAMNGHKND